MAAVYLGSFTVGGSVPGLSAAFEQVGEALASLRATGTEALSVIESASAVIDAQVTLLGAAKVAIRVPAAADLDAQLTATLKIAAGLSLQASDPAAYLAGLVAGVSQVQTRLTTLVPSVALSAQATASAAIAARLEAKISAIDLELEALTTIGAQLTVQASALASVQAAIAAVLDATLAAAALYVSISQQLVAGGLRCLLYTGPLSGLGAGIDDVTAGIGISADAEVVVPIVIVEATNTQGVSGVNAVFRTA